MVRFFERGAWTFAADSIPPIPGIYILRHDSGAVYVGMTFDLQQRCGQWYSAVYVSAFKAPRVKGRMQSAITTLDRKGWAFSVVLSGLELTRGDLSRLERRAIRRAIDKGMDVLNIQSRVLERATKKQYRPSYSQLRRARPKQSITKVTDSEP